jgi:hypothetical protein
VLHVHQIFDCQDRVLFTVERQECVLVVRTVNGYLELSNRSCIDSFSNLSSLRGLLIDSIWIEADGD